MIENTVSESDIQSYQEGRQMMKKTSLLLIVLLVAFFQLNCATKKRVKKEVDAN